MSEPEKRKGLSPVAIVLIVVGALAFVGIAVVGVMAALAIHGTRRYLSAAKQAEGKAAVAQLARGIVACSEIRAARAPASPGGHDLLPPTSAKVPASLSSVSGKKHMSAPAEWEDEAFRCAGFRMESPQYFQYQWERGSTGNGVARAVADLDGDGTPDQTYEVPVACGATGDCSVGAPRGF